MSRKIFHYRRPLNDFAVIPSGRSGRAAMRHESSRRPACGHAWHWDSPALPAPAGQIAI